MTTTVLEKIKLSLIEPVPNYRDVDPPKREDPDMIELAASVKKDGVLQPVLLRPHPKKPGTYQLIFGHRRFLACQMISPDYEIPANIKEVPDENILELQVIENMQRKDVHSMDEALAFRALMKEKGYSVDDLAAKFSKSKEYITGRLKLNDLVADLQKVFKKNAFLVGHAVQLARLTPVDQLDIFKNYARNGWGSINSLQAYISQNIIRMISTAPWRRDDATLVPEAGACNGCAKCSGQNPTLFHDIQENDRCFDKACFQKKMDAWMINEVKLIIETKPEVKFIVGGYGDPASKTLLLQLKEMKVPVFEEYKHFEDHPGPGHREKVTAFWVNTGKKGKTSVVYFKSKDQQSGIKIKGSLPEEGKSNTEIISGIKERTKRAAELDTEKVYNKIIAAIRTHKTQKELGKFDKIIPGPEYIAMLYMIYNMADRSTQEDIRKKCGIKDSLGTKPADLYLSLQEMSNAEITYMIRKVFIHRFTSNNAASNNPASDQAYIVRKMADSYKDIPVREIERIQEKEREKREARAAQRIEALKPKKKALSGKNKNTPPPKKNRRAASTKA